MRILMWRINFTFRNETLQSPVDRFCRWKIFGNLRLQQNKVCPLFNSSCILTTYAFTKIIFFFHSWPCAYCSRSRFVAHRVLMILILSPLSVCDITSTEPEELSPRSRNRYSPRKCSGSAIVYERLSAKAVIPSRNETPCFFSFFWDFNGSHSNSSAMLNPWWNYSLVIKLFSWPRITRVLSQCA